MCQRRCASTATCSGSRWSTGWTMSAPPASRPFATGHRAGAEGSPRRPGRCTATSNYGWDIVFHYPRCSEMRALLRDLVGEQLAHRDGRRIRAADPRACWWGLGFASCDSRCYLRLRCDGWIPIEGGCPVDRVQVNVRVDVAVKRAVESYCRPRGVAMNHFVQEARWLTGSRNSRTPRTSETSVGNPPGRWLTCSGNWVSMPRYEVRISQTAAKQLRRLPRADQERVAAKASALATDPRPPGTHKLRGYEDVWRVRVGPYRILYSVADAEVIVIVLKVGHRSRVYR